MTASATPPARAEEVSPPTPPADRLPDFVVAVNYDAGETIGWPAFTEVTLAGRVDLPADVDNDENGGPLWLRRGLRRPWADIWQTEVRHAG
ncbi:hypothetical protein ACQPYA_16005 [Micromonospora sp. CA-263727]|uniref:hypothetical protein n=1 Tax=Micromonospora sp. CA-263727 TaxID=3239967 RepID=UPI003D8B72BA